MKSSKFSIIIANWNGGEVFKNCLKSLRKLDYPNWELIIVDNGSTDDSQKYKSILEESGIRVRLIQNNHNLGFAIANNQGFKISVGKYVLLLNNDTTVAPKLLSVIAQKFESDPMIGIIQPKIKLMDKKGYLDNAGSFFTRIGFLAHRGFNKKDGPEFNEELEVFSTKGACMAIRREIIKKVGLFDKTFFSYFEESDFCWRVWLAGFRVIYYPRIYIYHKVGFTIRRLNVYNINYYYYRNRIRSIIKNLEFKNLIIVLTFHLIISMGISCLFLLRSQFKNSWMIQAAVLWNLGNTLDNLRERKKVQRLRKVSDKDFFKDTEQPINWRQYFNDFKRVEKDLRRKST